MKNALSLSALVLSFCCFGLHGQSTSPTNPTYFSTFGDAITGNNRFTNSDGEQRWDVDAGADNYFTETYERPVDQGYTYDKNGGRYATAHYWGGLDIVEGKYGYDDTYMYFSIDMWADHNIDQSGSVKEDGLSHFYGVRFNNDTNPNGGFLVRTENPVGNDYLNSTRTASNGWQSKAVKVFQDTNSDVAGLGVTVTKNDVHNEVNNNGYEVQIADNGAFKNANEDDIVEKSGETSNVPTPATEGAPAAFARITQDTVDSGLHEIGGSEAGNLNDFSIIEFAVPWEAYGFSLSDVQTLVSSGFILFETIEGGPKDNQNYFWNDEYTYDEGGSPYDDSGLGTGTTPGGDGFDYTDGNPDQNIYKLDTLTFIDSSNVIPEPSTYCLFLGAFALGFVTWKRKRKPAENEKQISAE